MILDSRVEIKEIQVSPLIKFGQVLTMIRKVKKMSVEGLARESGVDEEAITRFEAGDTFFEETILALPKLAKALGVSKQTLFKVIWALESL